MQHPKRGRCIILNFKHFDNSELRSREGTDLDASTLHKTFSLLNFEVEIYHNLSFKSTMEILNTGEQKKNFLITLY